MGIVNPTAATDLLFTKLRTDDRQLNTDHYFFAGGGAGYSGSLSLLVSARFTSSSSNRSDGLMTVVGTPPGRLLTKGSLPAAITAVRSARVSSSLNTAPRTSSSWPSLA